MLVDDLSELACTLEQQINERTGRRIRELHSRPARNEWQHPPRRGRPRPRVRERLNARGS
jgi:hypothetical protein